MPDDNNSFAKTAEKGHHMRYQWLHEIYRLEHAASEKTLRRFNRSHIGGDESPLPQSRTSFTEEMKI